MTQPDQYLIDTNVISELRKQDKANPGVQRFFQQAVETDAQLYISVITIGELRRGVERIRCRGDRPQAALLEVWLETILNDYTDHILNFTELEAQVWGRLRVPHYENAIDKQIAATALTCNLTLVTRNVNDFLGLGVTVFNPFE
ncbi:MAG: type II toxin-antitoxin system VapC family toxin [Cyanobacteria bacterium P01_G01_bin.54]